MNLVLLAAPDIIPHTSRALLRGRRHAHVLTVHRARPGDVLNVGLEDGQMGQGKVLRLTDTELEMEVVFNTAPPPKVPVILAVALMRPPVLKRVLQTATAMGVTEIHIFHARRVEKSFWNSTSLAPAEIREQLVLGLEQAKDTRLPSVIYHKKFKPFVEDVLPNLLLGRRGVVADPSGQPFNKGAQGPAVLIIGPEGGFIPYELEKFLATGCVLAGLGPRILRVETAVTAFLTLLS